MGITGLQEMFLRKQGGYFLIIWRINAARQRGFTPKPENAPIGDPEKSAKHSPMKYKGDGMPLNLLKLLSQI